jgi:DNA-binding CsgD family transcriptional regulator
VLAAQRAKGQLQTRLAELTERERDVMELVAKGLPNKLIADQLAISVRTVEVHRARVFDKMEVKSAVELANLLRDVSVGALRCASGVVVSGEGGFRRRLAALAAGEHGPPDDAHQQQPGASRASSRISSMFRVLWLAAIVGMLAACGSRAPAA